MKNALFFALSLFTLIIINSCNSEYEQLHETIPLTINYEKDAHIFAFSPNLEIGGSFLWEFGDGTTSNVKSPIHIYDEMGLYEINLSVVEGNKFYEASTNIIIDGIRDIEENLYPTARTGNQLWMTENLMTITCSDGTPLDTDHYQLGEDGITRYNHLALEQCDLCPEGWILPTPQDILALKDSEKTALELKTLLQINEEVFGGYFKYMMFKNGERLWHGDFESYFGEGGYGVTTKGDEEDYSVIRCIKIF